MEDRAERQERVDSAVAGERFFQAEGAGEQPGPSVALADITFPAAIPEAEAARAWVEEFLTTSAA